MSAAQPPVARALPHTHLVHDDPREDPYFWLREKSNPEVVAYLEAENAYADGQMEPTRDLQETLYQEMLGRILETDLTVPYRENGYLYYTRTEEGKQYRIQCRKREAAGTEEAEEEVYLDQNVLAEGHPFLAVGVSSVSDDGHRLAFSVDVSGFREYELFIKDLRTGELLPDRVGKVSQAVWAGDGRTLLYLREDDAKRSYRVYRHIVGTDAAADELLYEETDPLFRLSLYRSDSRAYLFVVSGSFTTSEVRYLPADRPGEALQLMLPREEGHEYYPEHHGDRFYLRTNDRGRNFRLVSVPVSAPARDHWTEVLPHRPEVMLESLTFFRHHLVISQRRGGLPQFSVTDLRSGEEHAIEFPEPAYSVFLENNREFDTTLLRFNYQSFITPPSVFDYAMETRSRTLRKQTPVLGGYDPSLYQSERIHATVADGTRVPISLVYRKELVRDGARPLFLYAYGSYGFSLPVTFQSERLSLLDRGVVYAVAHIRGGGEMGKAWHDHGKMMEKRNTFTDFIAAAEHLIAEGYTAADRLGIAGGSAGGLLMGAVVNMRPDLFRVVLSYVPFVDVLNTMLDDTLPLTVGEYLEWGNPNRPDEYAYMKTYCPYTNLEPKEYPAMLVRTSFNDSQVMYWEPAKYVARLRALKTDRNPLLFKTNMGAGHGGASGRYDALRDRAYDYAFLLRHLNVR